LVEWKVGLKVEMTVAKKVGLMVELMVDWWAA
jgi:hypothetical protein